MSQYECVGGEKSAHAHTRAVWRLPREEEEAEDDQQVGRLRYGAAGISRTEPAGGTPTALVVARTDAG